LDDNNIRHYNYIRKRVSSDGTIKEYTQKQSYITAEASRKDELQKYIDDILKVANKKVYEINKIEKVLKSILKYRGYNKKNLNQRLFRLEKADELTNKDRELLTKIMKRQKRIAGDLTDLLTFILQLYDVHDTEIKQLKKQLEEYDKE
jgi:DNA repair ATPase RecN